MNIKKLLKQVSKNDCISDLHLTIKHTPVVRYNGELQPIIEIEPLNKDDLENVIDELMNDEQKIIFEKKGEIDFSYSLPGIARFRVNAYQQRGSVCLALRAIPTKVPTIKELGLPQTVKKLSKQRKGLILCTGPTGSGKSTTLASMINEINTTRQSHILTLEDPIEYLHHHQKSLVHQREVGSDTQSFANGLRAALRQDPDVILVGEMRDLETISIALEAAETGHLVLATLHTNNAPQTIERVVDVFPAHQQQQVRVQLAAVLNGIISQQLLPTINNQNRVVALEILIGTPAIRNLIREGKSHQIESSMQTGAKYGMELMDNYLLKLYKKELIDLNTTLRRANNPKELKERISQIGSKF
ncbi:MAG: type IV pilus twitching motility protein PilT [bacterium]